MKQGRALALYAFVFVAAAAFIVSYLLLKMFRQRGLITPPVWLPLFMVGLSPFIACSAFMGFEMYQSATFPSPAPYSGAAVKKVWSDIGHGQYDVVTYEYTIDLSLEELGRHYNAEMQQYCVQGWEFAPTHLDYQGFAQCYTAECEILRPFVKEAQFFSVYLRSISETQTNVLYFVKDQTF